MIILIVIDSKYRFSVFQTYRWVVFRIWNKIYSLFSFFTIFLSIFHKNIVLLMIMTVIVFIWKQKKKKDRWILMFYVFSLYSNSYNIYNAFDVFSSLLLFYDIFFQKTIFFKTIFIMNIFKNIRNILQYSRYLKYERYVKEEEFDIFIFYNNFV